MPDPRYSVAVLLLRARKDLEPCWWCGRAVPLDYCHTCELPYWIHAYHCAKYDPHGGHRVTIVPFVEVIEELYNKFARR